MLSKDTLSIEWWHFPVHSAWFIIILSKATSWTAELNSVCNTPLPTIGESNFFFSSIELFVLSKNVLYWLNGWLGPYNHTCNWSSTVPFQTLPPHPQNQKMVLWNFLAIFFRFLGLKIPFLAKIVCILVPPPYCMGKNHPS